MVWRASVFAGEDFGLRLDVILEINHEVVGIRAAKGEYWRSRGSISMRAVPRKRAACGRWRWQQLVTTRA